MTAIFWYTSGMNKLLLILLMLSFASNLFFGYLFATSRKTIEELAKEGSEDYSSYPYLSKRIFVEMQNDILINFTPLRAALRDYMDKRGEDIGVYFEYLPSGSSIGINSTTEYKIASLIKIPIVIAVYKQIQLGKMTKNTTFTITDKDIDKAYGDLWKKGTGTKITVREAVNLALTESDNTASRTLANHLPEDALDEIFDYLDIPKQLDNEFPILSPKNYTSILRALYLSSYIPNKYSNEILDILTTTKQNDKLPAGIPPDTKVAHKIGVFRPVGSTEKDQIFTDCGIVYVPNRPYSLCLMAITDEDKAREIMTFISRMVYKYVSTINKKPTLSPNVPL